LPLQNFGKRLLVSSFLCVRLSIRVKHAAASGIIVIKLIFEYFSKICRGN